MRSWAARQMKSPTSRGSIELALRLSQTLDLPQRDGITITDADGRVLYSGDVDADALSEGRSRP